MHEFSVPMPFQKEGIDELIKINNEVKKSKITSLYFSLPGNCKDTCGFEQTRLFLDYGHDFDYWKPLIQYSLEKGFDFIYLLNSPNSFNIENLNDLNIKIKKLHNLLLMLQDIGVNKLRVANTQIMNYLRTNYPSFQLYGSTSLEYTNLKQFDHFFKTFPDVKNIVPSFDLNKNFKTLKNLTTKYPDVKFELMVNEGCIAGCPFRNHHNQICYMYQDFFNNINPQFTRKAFGKMCGELAFKTKKSFFEYLCKSNIIYPWEIEEYSKIGINNFKIVGRDVRIYTQNKKMDFYTNYLIGIDDFSKIKDVDLLMFNKYLAAGNDVKDIKIGEIREYLPNIKYFIQNGHLCSSRCGVECTYCEECARKLEEKFGDRLEFLKKM